MTDLHAGPVFTTGGTAFGRRLRDLRLQVGLSQKRLANSSTLSVRAIRDLENGRVRQPRQDTLRLLADALDLSAPQMDWLANDKSPGVLAGSAEPAVCGQFIGREHELAALTTMLGTEHHRLVTITGIEGVGKTRLALEVAHALEAVEHSTVLWMPLDDDQLHGGTETDSLRRLVERIGVSNALLVLDGARPGGGLADITANLVAACPRLRVIVTTRNPGSMALDTLFPLAPLPVPLCGTESADAENVASVALLLAHLTRVQPGFRRDPQVLGDVVRICRALDGLPAALEAAAHWSLIYSLPQIASQLTTEPLSVARRPHSHCGHQRSDPFASVRHTIAALSARQRDLLSTMSQRTDGCWSVPEVADTMGLSAAECADDVYHLLILGLLRRVDSVDRADVAKFTVLNVVGLAGQNVAA